MKLIPNWRGAWRFLSMQSMALATLLQGAWLGLPPDLRDVLPVWVPPVIAIGILTLGMLGRLVDQPATRKEARRDD